MGSYPTPFIGKVPYNEQFAEALHSLIRSKGEEQEAWETHQLRFPTIYIVRSLVSNEYSQGYKVYVGETNDIIKRTRQHLLQDSKVREDWQEFKHESTAEMYVIGHPYFNKSLTLDIENRFLHYLESCQSVKFHNNRRTNEQREYYTLQYLDDLFALIWDQLIDHETSEYRELETKPRRLFEPREVIEKSSIFKASPFHKLNDAQLAAQNAIFEAINDALDSPADRPLEPQSSLVGPQSHRLILVNGEAGSGKTVLMSSIFNGLISGVRDEDERFRNLVAGPDGEGTNIDAYLISGHKNEGGQFHVYDEIVKKLGLPKSRLGSDDQRRVYKPTTFINQFSPNSPADVVLIDEAHLLLTQKSLGYYEDKPQIEAILDRAKIVVAVFDDNQVLEAPQYWKDGVVEYFRNQGRLVEDPIQLESQLRIDADAHTISWLRGITKHNEIGPMRVDSKGYDLRIFETPGELEEAIREKDSETENSLARLLATFDWKYSGANKNADREDGLWYVDVHHPESPIHLPWNLQTKNTNQQRRIAYRSAWSEEPATINEVGSTYTIQGFDLNYAGVILGPSVTFRRDEAGVGRIVIDPSKSAHGKAVQTRHFELEDGQRVSQSFGEDLIANEVNVLLTRGVKGLYIYAVDEELRNELLRRQEEREL